MPITPEDLAWIKTLQNYASTPNSYIHKIKNKDGTHTFQWIQPKTGLFSWYSNYRTSKNQIDDQDLYENTARVWSNANPEQKEVILKSLDNIVAKRLKEWKVFDNTTIFKKMKYIYENSEKLRTVQGHETHAPYMSYYNKYDLSHAKDLLAYVNALEKSKKYAEAFKALKEWESSPVGKSRSDQLYVKLAQYYSGVYPIIEIQKPDHAQARKYLEMAKDCDDEDYRTTKDHTIYFMISQTYKFENNIGKERKFLQKSYDLKYPPAGARLAEIMKNNPKEADVAQKTLKEAAQMELDQAFYKYYNSSYNGGSPRTKESYQTLLELVDKKHPQAIEYLAKFDSNHDYESSDFYTKQDIPRLTQLATEKNSAIAKGTLAEIYRKVNDKENAKKWYALLTGVKDTGQYKINYIDLLIEEKNWKEAENQISKLTDETETKTKEVMGKKYFELARAIEKTSPRNSDVYIELYKKAGEAGYTWAFYTLAKKYEKGKGVKQNNRAALDYLKKASVNHHIPNLELAIIYHSGLLGVVKDETIVNKYLDFFKTYSKSPMEYPIFEEYYGFQLERLAEDIKNGTSFVTPGHNEPKTSKELRTHFIGLLDKSDKVMKCDDPLVPYAPYWLGFAYFKGDMGVEKDLEKAKKFLMRAQELGLPRAKAILKTIEASEAGQKAPVVSSEPQGLYPRLDGKPVYVSPKSLKTLMTVGQQAAKSGEQDKAFLSFSQALRMILKLPENEEKQTLLNECVRHLSEFYEKGKGLNGTEDDRLVTFEQFERQTSDELTLQLAISMSKGENGLIKDELNAEKLLTILVNRDSSPARMALSHLYLNGSELIQDVPKALALLDEETHKDNPEAYFQLANFYKIGAYGVEKDVLVAEKYFIKAARLGHAEAKKLYPRETSNEMTQHYLELANKGDAKAQYELAIRFRDGLGTEKDNEKTFEWLEKASAQGHSDALYELGLIYKNERNLKKAQELFKQAAEQGHAKAKRILRKTTSL